MDKKICILTSYTNTIRWDDYGKCDYCDLSSINHNEYANKHGYSYIKEIAQYSQYLEWHPTWIKIDVLRKFLPFYDYVVWIDADAVFVNQEIKIEEFILDGVDLVLPKMEKDHENNIVWTHTSTGFMVWKNSEWSLGLLNKMWNEPNEHRTGYFHEQSRLDELLYDKFILAGGENILNKSEEDLNDNLILDNINILPYSYHRCVDDGSVIKYVFHAGGNTYTKYERIKNVLN